jgi:photosystem II stability/assembly factor-like uncharacterized protein
MGVFRSTDGGNTWSPLNTGMGNVTVGMFARVERNPDIILAAANGGVYKTIDRGENWVRTPAPQGNFTDIRFRPGSSTFVYAASRNGFYRSEDCGETWSAVPASSGYVIGDRQIIGVTPANDSLVYLVTGNNIGKPFNGCFLSRDFGKTFTVRATTPNILGYTLDGSDNAGQAGYDLCLYVDPVNPMTLMVGGIWLWKSTNGGFSWQVDLQATSIHMDQHIIRLNPLNKRLYVGNDGGLYSRNNGSNYWNNHNNDIGIGQIYRLGVSSSTTYAILGGLQDNGTSLFNGSGWSATNGGDGMECAFDPLNSDNRFTTQQDGSIWYGTALTNRVKIAGMNLNGITEQSSFIVPFTLGEVDPNTIIVGYQNVWICRNIRSGPEVIWTKISDNLGGTNSADVLVVENSPADPGIFYMARSDGKVFHTDDVFAGTVRWTQLPKLMPATSYQPCMDIQCHPYDPNIVYFLDNKKVYKSIDRGLTLVDITRSIPNVPLSTLVYDKTSNEGLYVGSDAGVFYKDAGMSDWVYYGMNLPVSVKVTELEIYYDPANRQNSRLVASTYGRGVWDIGLAEANPALPPVMLKADAVEGSVELTWNPPFYKTSILNYKVYRNGIPIATLNNLSYTDPEVEKEITYTYKVTALYANQVESEFSNEASVTVIDPVTLPYFQPFEKGLGGYTGKMLTDGWNYGTSEQLGISGNPGHFYGIGGNKLTAGVRLSDYLISPVINLSPWYGKTVTLKFAYTFQKKTSSESFSVVYRVDPDSAWVSLKNLDLPSRTQWQWDTVSMDLPNIALRTNMQIGFYYNNPYPGPGAAVDDVELFLNTSGAEIPVNLNSLRVYPNPSRGRFTLEMITNEPDEISMRVISITGQTVIEKRILLQHGTTRETVDISSQPEGIYQLIIYSDKGNWKDRMEAVKLVVYSR